MQKYVVKNCPAYNSKGCIYDACITPDSYNSYDDIEYMDKCRDIDNCLIKQVIEKCNEAISTYDNEEFYEDDCDRFLGESAMAQEILELFEIGEIK